MTSRRSSRPRPRVPQRHKGIQVNFCKKPQCGNYGVPASAEKQPRGPGSKQKGRDTYTVVGSTHGRKHSVPVLNCHKCNERPPIKSNQGIVEERERISAYLKTSEPSCPNELCSNHTVGISDKKHHYHSIGKTNSGSNRYRCLACRMTFSVSLKKPASRHILPHKNSEVFNLLVNNVPMRRICKITGINQKTLYDKIRFIHKQMVTFVASRERKLISGELDIDKLYLSVDRQDHMINWGNRSDKRQTQFQAIGTADNESSYVFGIHLNYEPALDPDLVEDETVQNGHYLVAAPFRRHARLWLQGDYMPAIVIKAKELDLREENVDKSLTSEILETYNVLSVRKDVESFDQPAAFTKFPSRGMQVHAEYTLYGHFYFLSELFAHVNKLRFFLDQESGIRAACLAAFEDRILARECDAFYVSINKRMTNDQKEKAMRDIRKQIRELEGEFPYGLSFADLRRILIERNLPKSRPIGPWRDMWVEVPSRIKSEPEKQVCHLTDFNDIERDHMAALMDLASLHGIDRFFAQVRNSVSLLARSTSSASNAGRRWFQRNAYNPEVAAMLLDIYRVNYNYLEIGADKKTPAMRLGLASAKIRLTDILNNDHSMKNTNGASTCI